MMLRTLLEIRDVLIVKFREQTNKQIECSEIEPNPLNDRTMHGGYNPNL
jgi:hypothetical protein